METVYEVTHSDLDRLKVIYEELWRLTQELGNSQLDECRQRLRMWIEEAPIEEREETE